VTSADEYPAQLEQLETTGVSRSAGATDGLHSRALGLWWNDRPQLRSRLAPDARPRVRALRSGRYEMGHHGRNRESRLTRSGEEGLDVGGELRVVLEQEAVR
jgi:hypothetical protein